MNLSCARAISPRSGGNRSPISDALKNVTTEEQRRASSLLALTVVFPFLALNLPARAQLAGDPPTALFIHPPFEQPKDRITSFIDDEQTVALHGNRHPSALPQYDTGIVSPDYPMERMLLTLLPDATQQDALNQLLEAQHDPDSPYYHQWLTPEQYGERFGISEATRPRLWACFRNMV
jgi:hypothetical protein